MASPTPSRMRLGMIDVYKLPMPYTTPSHSPSCLKIVGFTLGYTADTDVGSSVDR
jgi:hypothetical protein